jgi:hypothetical protein
MLQFFFLFARGPDQLNALTRAPEQEEIQNDTNAREKCH